MNPAIKAEFPNISIHIENATILVPRDGVHGFSDAGLSVHENTKPANADRFELVLNGTAVMDHSTGLMWARDVSPELDWESAAKYCSDFRLGDFNDWRMAKLDERQGITDYDRHNPALHPLFNWQSDYEWTSKITHWTEDNAGSSRSFWFVSMGYGNVYYYYADYRLRVRPVRRAVPAGQ